LKLRPPHITDQAIIALMKRIGIEVGKRFDIDEETLELALLAKEAIGSEAGDALDAAEVAQILGVHKRYAHRLIKSTNCQMKKKSHTIHKTITGHSQESHKTAQPDGPQKNMCKLCSVK
jgi:hypothetical protein